MAPAGNALSWEQAAFSGFLRKIRVWRGTLEIGKIQVQGFSVFQILLVWHYLRVAVVVIKVVMVPSSLCLAAISL